jgi:hypothetical protein
MGSRTRNSTRKIKPPADPKSRRKPFPPPAKSLQRKADNVVGLLDDTGSVVTVALKALDNIDERNERRLDAPLCCRADDVATVLRSALARLYEAREALQNGVVEGKP